MNTSPRGIALIQSFETLELEAYPDPGSPLGRACTQRKLPMRDYRKVIGGLGLSGAPWTNGWGHTGSDVYQGQVWTQEHADYIFRLDLADFDEGLGRLVKAPVNQNQWDALASFAYNCGLDEDSDIIPEGLGDSTLLKYVNQGKHVLAASEFLKWNKSGGVLMGGLVRRRKTERDLYLKPMENSHG